MARKKSISVQIELLQFDWVEAECNRTGASAAYIIRKALDNRYADETGRLPNTMQMALENALVKDLRIVRGNKEKTNV